MRKMLCLMVLSLGLLVAFYTPTQASIYLRVEDTGVYEITNNPSSKEYTELLETGSGGQVPEPDQIKQAVQLAANKYHFPESIIYAVIRGNNTRQGGLMGIPSSVREKMSDTAVQDPFTNVDTGTRRLYELLGEFKGNLTLALAAYRAGKEAVREVGGIPPRRKLRKFVDEVRKSFRDFEKRSEVIYTYRDEQGNLTLVNIH